MTQKRFDAETFCRWDDALKITADLDYSLTTYVLNCTSQLNVVLNYVAYRKNRTVCTLQMRRQFFCNILHSS